MYKDALSSSKNIDNLLHYSSTFPGISIHKIHLQSDDSDDTEDALERSPSTPRLPRILSSSGGLLLLHFSHGRTCLVVFNPVTGAYRFIPSTQTRCIGFAYELTNPSAYKLVAACQDAENEKMYTFKIFDSDGSNWRVSPTTCSTNGIPLVEGFQAVYLNDSLHWLTEDGEVLVFNVKKELAMIIRKPEDIKDINLANGKHSGIFFCVHAWIGVSQGFLAMVVAYNSKIYIYAYDSTHSKWKLDREFENKIAYGHRNGCPVFYDGKRLVQIGGNFNGEIYLYDVAATSWMKIGELLSWMDRYRTYRPFFRTLATIPNCSYLLERREENPEVLEILSLMQEFLS